MCPAPQQSTPGDTLAPTVGTCDDAVGTSAASLTTRWSCAKTAAARALLKPPAASNARTSERILAAAPESPVAVPAAAADATPFASLVSKVLAATLTAVECAPPHPAA